MTGSNIGNARVLGLAEDTGLVKNQYNIALMVFFFPYSLLEVPANLLLKKLKPSVSSLGRFLTVDLQWSRYGYQVS